MNRVILMGNLTRDPEVRYSTGENQMAITRFSVAVQRRFSRNAQQNGQPEADFINCVAFGKTGETIGNYFTKGRKILVSGRLQNNNWEDQNGQKHYGMDVIVEDFEFCERRGDGEGGATQYSAPARSSAPEAPKPASTSEKFYDAPTGVDEEDLPF